MAKKSIESFRADKNIWRSELAEKLDISENSLEFIEKHQDDYPQIEKQIIELYKLPENYFDDKKAKKAPDNKFLYFLRVSFIWLIAFTIIKAIVTVPLQLAVSLNSGPNTFYNILSTVCGVIVTIRSGIYLTSYINKNSDITHKINRYDYMYPFLISSLIIFLEPLFKFLTSPNPATCNGVPLVTTGYGILMAFIGIILGTFLCSYMLYAISCMKDKTQTISLGIIGTISALGYVTYIILEIVLLQNTSVPFIVESVLYVALLIASSVMMVIFDKKSKLNDIWFSLFPIVAMCLKPIVMVLVSLIK